MKKKITISTCDYAHVTGTLLGNGDVLVETLYRYGKPGSRVYTKEEFIAWRDDINKTSKQESIFNY